MRDDGGVRVDGKEVEVLLAWYDRVARDLPWRRTRDPYGIWVAEVMLQQTQVRTVLGYWERWMAALPGVEALAEASDEVILKLWEGLGYYRRVRNLRAAARVMREQHGGRFPETFEAIWALPGVGRYTAGAVGSLAFDLAVPVVDGNVMRVMTRRLAWGGDPRRGRLAARLWVRAAAWVERAVEVGGERASGRWNQALMELGATVCRPRPDCGRCPWAKECRAHAKGQEQRYPELGRRPGVTQVARVVWVVQCGEWFWVRQRPVGVVNGGLWEFPNLELEDGEGVAEGWAREWFGSAVAGVEAWEVVRHAITRYRITQRMYRVTLTRRPKGGALEGVWVRGKDLEGLAWVSAHRRVVGRLAGGRLHIGECTV
jgi:A/G-specific adenine glycosylase